MKNGYDMYIGDVRMPVTPPEIRMSINNQNRTITLINEGEVNLLKSPALTDISFTILIPQVNYSFAKQNMFVVNKSTGESSPVLIPASYYLDLFAYLKIEKIPFRWIVSRCLPNGKLLFDTNMKVSLEDYKVKESAKQGFDLEIEVSLKQYKPYTLKTISLTTPSPTAPVIVREDRDEDIPVKQLPSVGGSSGGGGGGGGSGKKKKPSSSSAGTVGALAGAVISVGIGLIAGLIVGSAKKTSASAKKTITKPSAAKKAIYLK